MVTNLVMLIDAQEYLSNFALHHQKQVSIIILIEKQCRAKNTWQLYLTLECLQVSK